MKFLLFDYIFTPTAESAAELVTCLQIVCLLLLDSFVCPFVSFYTVVTAFFFIFFFFFLLVFLIPSVWDQILTVQWYIVKCTLRILKEEKKKRRNLWTPLQINLFSPRVFDAHFHAFDKKKKKANSKCKWYVDEIDTSNSNNNV